MRRTGRAAGLAIVLAAAGGVSARPSEAAPTPAPPGQPPNAGTPAGGEPSAAARTPIFGVAVSLVRVEVLATRKGRPIHGLRASDFELRDNGRVQALEPVVEERVPVDAVLVLDMSYSVSGAKLQSLREAAGALVDGLRADETATLLTFQEKTTFVQPPTGDMARIRRALAATRPRGSTALRDAVYAALRVREPGTRRTAVVIFSDGLDNLSWLPADAVVEAARRSDAVVYAVAAHGRREREDPFLGDVTTATGGRLWISPDPSDLPARFLDVLEDIRARYLLSFVPSDAGPAGWHELQVRLKGRGGDVLARPGYWSRQK